MNDYLSISVVTPSFNQGEFIEEAIRSVIQQGYPRYEHIIIDGDSQDKTREVLGNYPQVKWVSEKDRGQAHAINKGLGCAQGSVLAYLCADDTYEPEAFHYVNEYFQHHPTIGLIYGTCCFMDVEGNVLRRKKAVPFKRKRLLRHNIIWQPTVFFRASVWERLGPFNEELNFAMDYEYWLRAAERCSIAAVDRHLAN